MSVSRTRDRSDPSHEALVEALAEIGVACKVEVRGGLAVLVLGRDAATTLGNGELRLRALAAARMHGFSHLAIELFDDE